MDRRRLTQIIEEFIRTAPENSLKNKADEPAWEEVWVGFSSGSDPIGAFHFTPQQIFNATFAHLPATADELTVIARVLPLREITKRKICRFQ
jgi:hypothetical protein